MWQWVVFVGILLVESSYVPQLIRLYRVKTTAEISFWFPFMNLVGRLIVMVCSFWIQQQVLGFGVLLGIIFRTVFFVQVFYYKFQAGRKVNAPMSKFVTIEKTLSV